MRSPITGVPCGIIVPAEGAAMLAITEAPVDLDRAQVLSVFEQDMLVTALETALHLWEAKETEADGAGDVGAEIVWRMQQNAARDLLGSIGDRTVILADLVVDLD